MTSAMGKGTVFCLMIGMMLAAGPRAGAVSLQELTKKDNGGDRIGKPTTIVSDSMDIDFQKNNAVFTGNVFVDDPQMTIKCHKMVIYMQDKAKTEGGAPAKAKPDMAGEALGSIAPGGSGKELEKVICTGNVIITRKVTDKQEALKGEQRAEAGRAVYDFKEGTIVLTEDSPRISRGHDSLAGTKITLWLDSERMKVEGNDRQAKIRFVNPSADESDNGAAGKNSTQKP